MNKQCDLPFFSVFSDRQLLGAFSKWDDYWRLYNFHLLLEDQHAECRKHGKLCSYACMLKCPGLHVLNYEIIRVVPPASSNQRLHRNLFCSYSIIYCYFASIDLIWSLEKERKPTVNISRLNCTCKQRSMNVHYTYKSKVTVGSSSAQASFGNDPYILDNIPAIGLNDNNNDNDNDDNNNTASTGAFIKGIGIFLKLKREFTCQLRSQKPSSDISI